MSSIGLGKPPVIYPTPLDTDRANSSGVTSSPPLNRSLSSPLYPKYGKRRIKKLGNKSVLSPRGASKLSHSTILNSGNESGKISRKKTNDLDLQNDNTKEEEKNPIYVKDTEEYKLHLIRKIFLPKVPLDSNIKDYLPALTSSLLVDVELYCFIGLLFKNFVNEWYFKITENDEFISEVIDVVAHITRSLENRVKKVNLENVLLDSIPYILDNHSKFYCYCRDNLNSQLIQETTMIDAFEAINTHPALSKRFKEVSVPKFNDDEENGNYNFTFNESFYTENLDNGSSNKSSEEMERLEENYLGMLSKGSLALLLPVDVSNSNLARYFVRSVMSNIVLKILVKQLSEPDIIYTILLAAFRSMDKDTKKENKEVGNKTDNEELPPTLKGKIAKMVRSISHLIAYSTSTGSSSSPKIYSKPPIVDRYIFQFLNNLFSFSIENPIIYIFLKYFSLWFLSYNVTELRNVKKLEKQKRSKSSDSNHSDLHEKTFIKQSFNALVNAQLFSMKINQIIYNLFEKLVLQRFLKNEKFIGSILNLSRNVIFPNDDKMGPPRKIPNAEELEDMKIELFLRMKKTLPFWFKLLIFNEVGEYTSDDNEDLEEDEFGQVQSKFRSLIKTKTDWKFYQFIESFKYQKFNKLLVLNLTDHLFMRLFPELKDITPSNLERHD